MREATVTLMRAAKEVGTTLLIVGHVNKDAAIAGPKTLEHLVDAVFLLEGERNGWLRLLRATKNRFGATNEVGVFDMTDAGMVGVADATPLLREGGEAFGRVAAPIIEGTRPLLVEVQALVSRATYSSPRRVALGVTERRLSMLLAVLERYASIDTSTHDVDVGISSGITVSEPAIDAAIAVAIASSYWSTPVPVEMAVVGVVGLGGEMRQVRSLVARGKEAARSGITVLLAPAAGSPKIEVPRLMVARDLASALSAMGVLRPAGAEPVPGNRVPPSWAWKNRKSGADEEE